MIGALLLVMTCAPLVAITGCLLVRRPRFAEIQPCSVYFRGALCDLSEGRYWRISFQVDQMIVHTSRAEPLQRELAERPLIALDVVIGRIDRTQRCHRLRGRR